MPIILDGKSLAAKIELELAEKVREYKEGSLKYRSLNGPSLIVFIIGDNPASKMYVRMKQRAGERIGMSVIIKEFPEDVSAEDVYKSIDAQNKLKGTHGIMIQHPVPDRLMPLERYFFDRVDPKKDVDGVTSENFGRLSLGYQTSYQPATPKGIMTLLEEYSIPIEGRTVTIVGAGPILGKPLAMLMQGAGATVAACQRQTPIETTKLLCQKADIVVGACGVPGLIKKDWVKEGVVLVDAGCSPGNIGDIVPEAREKSYAYTPIPGGVGPMTIATLLSQTVHAARWGRYNEKSSW